MTSSARIATPELEGSLTPSALRSSPATQIRELVSLIEEDLGPRRSPSPLPIPPPRCSVLEEFVTAARHATMIAQGQIHFNRPLGEVISIFGHGPPSESPLAMIPPPTYASIRDNICEGDRPNLALIPAPPRTNLAPIATPTCTSPDPEFPMPGINPGPGWFVNKGRTGTKIHYRIPQADGRLAPAHFIRYDCTAFHPEVHATMGYGCMVYSRPFRASPNPYPRPALTKHQEYAFTDGETFTPIVDIAIKMDGDPSLAAEVSHFRAYRSEARRCATEMAELRRTFLKARQNARISLAHLATASAYTRIEPRVLHDLVDTQELPPSVCDDAIQEFANTWKEETEVFKDCCQWCENKGHDTWECRYLTKCVFCNTYGHLDAQCRHPHDKCTEKEVCTITCDHLHWSSYCPSKVRTYRA
jgi:hypothetical protein